MAYAIVISAFIRSIDYWTKTGYIMVIECTENGLSPIGKKALT